MHSNGEKTNPGPIGKKNMSAILEQSFDQWMLYRIHYSQAPKCEKTTDVWKETVSSRDHH